MGETQTPTAEAPPAQPKAESEEPKEKRAGSLARPAAGSAITEPARYGFKQDQIVAIKNTVASECSDAELVMFLEVAARYELDPFAKQIYAAKMKGRVQIIVSRDGLLAHAHKQKTFSQMDGDYICANDEFNVVFKDGKRQVEHSYSTRVDPGVSGPEGEPAGGRGALVAAWARVVREGHGETFFVANLSEYKQEREGPWNKTPAAMILKCAETYALRKAFSISGVVGEDEIEKERKRLTDVETGGAALPELDFYTRELAAIANGLEPNSYMPAKLAALAGDRDALINELVAFIAEKGGVVPDEPLEGDAEEVPVETPA